MTKEVGVLVTAQTVLMIPAIIGLSVLALGIRVAVLVRLRGAVMCCLRPLGGRRGWQPGVARYADGELQWIPFLAFGLRPRRVIARRGLIVSGRRRLPSSAMYGFLEGITALECRPPDVELAMSAPALMGFQAWVEAAPPGTYLSDPVQGVA